MSIYIGNLPYEVVQEELTAVFTQYGVVRSVHIPTDRETGRMRGFAFVSMGAEAEETAAIEALDGSEWMERELKVKKAQPRQERGGRLSS